jgi:N-acetylmuramoyl-L-alanine amidase
MTDFPPDPRLPVDIVPSPNHSERRDGARPDMILLHYTGMPDAAAALARLCDPASEVSAHYLVFEDGRIVQSVPEARRAWHAGSSDWAGVTDNNSRSIGVEIANPGHDHGYRDFPPAQIEAVIALCRDIIARRGIRPERVLGHSDIAPLRKQDPGERFPWAALHAAGIGHWVEPAPLTAGEALRPGATGTAVAALQRALHDYGYGVEITAAYDALTEAVVRAFQQHFRPARVDGIADPSTLDTLQRLSAARTDSRKL